jgi:Tfp pilus assembly protein PilF
MPSTGGSRGRWEMITPPFGTAWRGLTASIFIVALCPLLGSGCSAFRAELGLGVGIGVEIELPVVLHTGFSASGFYYLGHDYKKGWRAGTPSGHFDESLSFIFVHGTDDYGGIGMKMHECMAILPIWTSRENEPKEWQALEVRVFALFVAIRLGFNPWNWFSKEEVPPVVPPSTTPGTPTPTNAPPVDANLLKGTSSLQKGQYQKAVEELNASVAARPTAPAYYNLGLAHAALDQHLRAVECYREALLLDPSFQQAYGARAFSNLLSKRLPEAVQDFDQAIVKEPNVFRYYLGRGMARQSMQKPDLDAAIADFTKVLELEPNQAEALVHRLSAYIEKRDPRAEADFLKAQSLGIPLPSPMLLWGEAMGLTPSETKVDPLEGLPLGDDPLEEDRYPILEGY